MAAVERPTPRRSVDELGVDIRRCRRFATNWPTADGLPAERRQSAVEDLARTLAQMSIVDILVFLRRAAGRLCLCLEARRPGLGPRAEQASAPCSPSRSSRVVEEEHRDLSA